jgi:hypothetical protein
MEQQRSSSYRLLGAAGLILLLAGCSARIDDSTFALPWDPNGRYRIAVNVEELCCFVSIHPWVTINGGVERAMSRADTAATAPNGRIWELQHMQTDARGVQIRYRLTYSSGGSSTTKYYPSPSSEYQVPILGDYRTQWKLGDPMSDLDQDGIADRYDNCPFHDNPGQEDTQPSGGDGVGDACDILNIGRGVELAPRVTGDNIRYGKQILVTTIAGQSKTIRALEAISATAQGVAIQGIPALSSYSAQDLWLKQGTCRLAYQDDDFGHAASGRPRVFLQIYAGMTRDAIMYPNAQPDLAWASGCDFQLERGHWQFGTGATQPPEWRYVVDEVLARARHGIFVVVTDLDGSPATNPNYGRGKVFGRATLERGDAGLALFAELTAGHPTRYVYFVLKNLQLSGLRDNYPCSTGTELDCARNGAYYTAEGYLLPR